MAGQDSARLRDPVAGWTRPSIRLAAIVRTGNRATLRAALAVSLLSSWLVLLFAGHVAGGAVHLLFVASLVAFPWRAALAPGRGPSPVSGAQPPSPGSDEEEIS